MTDQAGTILGIDLGTTNSSVAVFEKGAVRVLPNALGELLTPSVVAWDIRNDELIVGRTAKDLSVLHPDRAAALFKRGMGSGQSYTVGPQTLSAVECSALVLQSLREDATRGLGAAVSRAVVTVPAYFNEDQRYATRRAGELAGLQVERILNEPTAAAIAHGFHSRDSSGSLLVIDLGGGTFDVCVMDLFEGALEVRSVAGESRLGGEDFTRRLAAATLERTGIAFEVAEAQAPDAVAILTKRCELLKRSLREADQGPFQIRVPGIAQGERKAPQDLEIEFGRAQLEQIFGPLIERLRDPIRVALRSAKLHRDQIDELILVGGATRLPQVQAFVTGLFGRAPFAAVDPDLAVVHGAAVQAALYARDAAVDDLVVTDIASHSLGMEICKEQGSLHKDGYFLPIIHRNTVIPTSRTKVVSTLYPKQKALEIAVYEGESRYVEKNRLIGSFELKDLPTSKELCEIEVRFTYDLSGILEVEARVVGREQKLSKIFTRTDEVLEGAQAAAAAETLRKLKADPAEEPRIRDLLMRAELLMQEASPPERAQLEQALDALENAIAERDPRRIPEATKTLSNLCEHLDGGERW